MSSFADSIAAAAAGGKHGPRAPSGATRVKQSKGGPPTRRGPQRRPTAGSFADSIKNGATQRTGGDFSSMIASAASKSSGSAADTDRSRSFKRSGSGNFADVLAEAAASRRRKSDMLSDSSDDENDEGLYEANHMRAPIGDQHGGTVESRDNPLGCSTEVRPPVAEQSGPVESGTQVSLSTGDLHGRSNEPKDHQLEGGADVQSNIGSQSGPIQNNFVENGVPRLPEQPFSALEKKPIEGSHGGMNLTVLVHNESISKEEQPVVEQKLRQMDQNASIISSTDREFLVNAPNKALDTESVATPETFFQDSLPSFSCLLAPPGRWQEQSRSSSMEENQRGEREQQRTEGLHSAKNNDILDAISATSQCETTIRSHETNFSVSKELSAPREILRGVEQKAPSVDEGKAPTALDHVAFSTPRSAITGAPPQDERSTKSHSLAAPEEKNVPCKIESSEQNEPSNDEGRVPATFDHITLSTPGSALDSNGNRLKGGLSGFGGDGNGSVVEGASGGNPSTAGARPLHEENRSMEKSVKLKEEARGTTSDHTASTDVLSIDSDQQNSNEARTDACRCVANGTENESISYYVMDTPCEDTATKSRPGLKHGQSNGQDRGGCSEDAFLDLERQLIDLKLELAYTKAELDEERLQAQRNKVEIASSRNENELLRSEVDSLKKEVERLIKISEERQSVIAHCMKDAEESASERSVLQARVDELKGEKHGNN